MSADSFLPAPRLGMLPLAFAPPALLAPQLGAKCTRCRTRRLRHRFVIPLATASPPPRPNDSTGGESNEEIDWNASWARFRERGMVSDAPKGRAPPTTAERARRRAQAQVEQVKASMPTPQMLAADWRFWVALLVFLSILTALLNSSSPSTGIPAAQI